RAHGLHAAGSPHRHGRRQLPQRGRRLRRGDVLRAHLRADVGRLLRHARIPVAPGLPVREPGGPEGPQPAQSLVCLHPPAADVLARRRAAHGGLLRQAGGTLGRGQRRPDLAGGGGGHPFADRRLLLPAHRQADVFRRAQGRDAVRRPGARPARAADGQRHGAAPARPAAAAADVPLLRGHQEPLSKLEEKKLSGSVVYAGKFLAVHKDKVRLPDGSQTEREYVHHPGAVGVVALTETGEVLLERQHRYPLRQDFIEIPAGKIDPGEAQLVTAKRELLEETGYAAAKWTRLGLIHNAIGYSDESIELWLARGLEQRG